MRWLLGLVGCILWAAPVWSDSFPQFRGPDGQGLVREQDVPLRWSATENLAWKLAIPGSGWSQPVVWEERLYLTSAVADKDIRPKDFAGGVRMPQSMGLGGFSRAPKVSIQWQVHCVDAQTGKLLWSQTVDQGEPKYPIHPSNTYATESPVVNAEGVIAFFGATGKLAALTHEGQPRWHRDLGAYPTSNGFGTGSSLAIDAERVFVQHYTQKSGVLAAFDAKTGEERWRQQREKNGTSWSSPILWRNEARIELLAAGEDLVTSHDPETGNELWRLSNIKAPTACSIAWDSGKLYFGGSDPFSKGPLFALSSGGQGDLSPDTNNGKFRQCAWLVPKAGPGMASPVSSGSYVFVAAENILRCYDAQTGERKYQTRLPEMKLVAASPLVIDDKLLVIDERGTSVFVAIGPTFELLGGGELDDLFWSTPAVANDTLFFRGVDHLYAVRKVPVAQ